MQPVDLTTLTAACHEIREIWLPARLEQVYQRDRFTISLGLRTLTKRGWLDICWHPQAARLCIGDPPPRVADTFTFSQQLRHQLGGFALVAIAEVSPWERVFDLQFAKRPGDNIIWHLYIEIMGKYSNVILATQENQIVTCAHQVNLQQSSVRPILTGQPYELPPSLTDPIPSVNESQERWQQRVNLVPGALGKNLLKSYRGLSSALVLSMIEAANLDPQQSTDTLTASDWDKLYQHWQRWLNALENADFSPHFTPQGYSIINWQEGSFFKGEKGEHPTSIQDLLNRYYTSLVNQQVFSQLRHQLTQKLSNIIAKLTVKRNTFQDKLQQSDRAEVYKCQADLLMANLHEWKVGMKSIILADFETNEPVTIPLDPEKNAIFNAQSFYKQHQKLKRARLAVEPLLKEVETEIYYLEQVATILSQLESYQTGEDLRTLTEIREELIQQKYIEDPNYRPDKTNQVTEFYHYESPSGFELLIGRNNRQNDLLSFRIAGDYDLWFHTQEIPGCHALLRLKPGTVPEDNDLEFAANLTAYYSQARHSEQVPVVYTEPKYVYKPKGAKPGMVVYKQERIIWGKPQQAFP
jgi:predicted ribosome quality control (RQC) complex YloA/Tae2 family protein